MRAGYLIAKECSVILRCQEVQQKVGLKKSAIYAGAKDGSFPKPIKLGPRTTAWNVADIRALIEAA